MVCSEGDEEDEATPLLETSDPLETREELDVEDDNGIIKISECLKFLVIKKYLSKMKLTGKA